MSVQVKVSADTTQLNNGLNQADKAVTGFARRVEGVKGAFSKVSSGFNSMAAGMTAGFAKIQGAWLGLVAAFAAFAGLKGLFDEVGRISDISQRFGESAETIQRLSQAAEIGGTDVENLTKALFKAQLAATDAAEGNEKMQEAFADLGINVENFMGLPLEEKLKAISEGYVNSENKAKANAAAIAIMGKSAMDLIPTLAMGAEGIEEAMEMTDQFSTTTAEKMGEVEDRFKAAFTNIKIFVIEVIGGILDAIDKMSVGIAAALAYVQNLPSGFKAASEAYDDTLNAGLDMLDQQKADRNEKNNRVHARNVAQIQAERVEESTDGAVSTGSTDFAAKNSAAKNQAKLGFAERIRQARAEAQAAAKAKAEEEAKTANENKLKAAEATLGNNQNILSDLESRQGRNQLDTLQRIGGGYANSTNQSGAAKQESLLQKQIDIQKEIVDQGKKTVEAIKNTGKATTNTDGITS